jgi:DNA-binding SARP family transcriptional activator
MSGRGPVDGWAQTMRIWLLDGFEVSVGSRTIEEGAWRLRKAASLVKLLALSTTHRLHREQVMNALWPDLGTARASNNLRQTLHAARRTLKPDRAVNSRYLSLREERLTLCSGERLWVHTEAFEEAAATARRSRDPSAFRLAIELYAGELLPGDRYEEWAEGRREELRRLYLALLLELAGLHEERAEHDAGVEALLRAAAEDPALEEAHAGLIRLYDLSDRRTLALAQYEKLRKALSEKLEIEPDPSTRSLYEEIAAGGYPPGEPTAPSVEETRVEGKHNLPSPRSSFIGSESELRNLKRNLAMTRLLTLTGVGGCGKTRLALEAARELVGAYPDGVWLGGYAEYRLAEGSTPGRLTETAAWFSSWSWILWVYVPTSFLLLLFPDGRLPSPRWRPVAWCAALGIVGFVAGYALEAGRLEDFPQIMNPYGLDSPIVMMVGVVAAILAAVSMVSSAVSLIVRMRRAGRAQRQQIKCSPTGARSSWWVPSSRVA